MDTIVTFLTHSLNTDPALTLGATFFVILIAGARILSK